MALMDLIEYVDEQSAEMAHRVPPQGSGEFKIGAQLIVRESQWAVFFRDGKAYDVFDAGRHTLSTQNIPLLTTALTTPLWGDTPFRSEVFFVTKRVFTDLKWGTSEPILFRDSEFKMIRLRSNGIYTFQITDPKLFVVKIVGVRGIYTNSQIEDFLRGVIVGRLADLLGESLETVLIYLATSTSWARDSRPVCGTTSPSMGWRLWILSSTRSLPGRRAEAHRRAVRHGSRGGHG